ncbi:MAG TPA: adenylyl-sulfate kinase [Phycisphaerales bacterium]|nr:adenylyl-sulfate kinase [Phycisphaerales bacterium]
MIDDWQIGSGTVYWITGLSGAGKTTIGRHLWQLLKEQNPATVFLDGDALRKVFSPSGYSLEERLVLGMQYSRLCQMLSLQNIDVVCATIAMFHQIHRWNRNNIENYFETYLSVPMEILVNRHPKDLYRRAQTGQIQNVYGVDLPFEEPEHPDVVIQNEGHQDPEDIARRIIALKKDLMSSTVASYLPSHH